MILRLLLIITIPPPPAWAVGAVRRCAHAVRLLLGRALLVVSWVCARSSKCCGAASATLLCGSNFVRPPFFVTNFKYLGPRVRTATPLGNITIQRVGELNLFP